MKMPESEVKENRQNPRLSDLDRLAEIMPPRRMIYWPYLIGMWSVG
jgi:hypothetical protein